MIVTASIRGLNKELLLKARRAAGAEGVTLGSWLNEAIKMRLSYDKWELPILLDEVAEETETPGVYKVPKGAVEQGHDYAVNRRHISAAGEKGDEVAVTYDSPSTLDRLGYRIFWSR
jgi:hypothetical protein